MLKNIFSFYYIILFIGESNLYFIRHNCQPRKHPYHTTTTTTNNNNNKLISLINRCLLPIYIELKGGNPNSCVKFMLCQRIVTTQISLIQIQLKIIIVLCQINLFIKCVDTDQLV